MSSTVSPKAASIALAATLLVVFVLCAIVQIILPSAQFSHAWIGLFTLAPFGSATAWLEGIVYSVAFGAVAGYVFAWAYNKAMMWKS